MSEYILLIALLSLIYSIMCRDYWICGNSEKYSCKKEETCCRSIKSISGWSCVPVSEGVCCSDGENFCSKGTDCNLKEMKCDLLNSPGFLRELKYKNIQPILSHKEVVVDVFNFVAGLNEGFEVFYNLSHENECMTKSLDPQIVNSALEIVHLIKSISIDSDLEDIIRQIAENAVIIFTKIQEAFIPCKSWTAELHNRIAQILNFIKNLELQKLVLHAVLNLQVIIDRVETGVNALKNAQYFNSGENFGILINFIVLYDFKP